MTFKIDVKDLAWKTGQVNGFLSKEFIQLSNGGVKLVKVEPMSVYPEHTHPDKTEYAFVIEGTPEFVIDSNLFSGKVGDFFIFPASLKHAIKNNTEQDCFLLVGSISI